MSSVSKYAVIIDGFIDRVVLWNGNTDTWRPEKGTAMLYDEAVKNGFKEKSIDLNRKFMTSEQIVDRLQQLDPTSLPKLWNSEHPTVATAAIKLFTTTGLINCEEGSNLRKTLAAFKDLGLLSQQTIDSLLAD